MLSTQIASTSKLVVSPRQRLNPMVKQVKNVGLEFATADIPSDFHVNQDVGVVYLSMKYHLMNPRYILGRLDQMLGYKQRVLLLLCDSEGADEPMVDLSHHCIAKRATLLVAFSQLEAARYLETLKLYETKPPDMIRGETPSGAHEDVFAATVMAVRSVNSSDAAQLGTTFGTMKALAAAQTEELLMCPGLGAKKARALRDAFENPL